MNKIISGVIIGVFLLFLPSISSSISSSTSLAKFERASDQELDKWTAETIVFASSKIDERIASIKDRNTCLVNGDKFLTLAQALGYETSTPKGRDVEVYTHASYYANLATAWYARAQALR